ncbi:LacI family transcriptional regulator [Haloferula helveola]|uniref:LacI family transcriptional regulator n=2 Tax=Haloferula helveola TaxID=490095 RepID=A0ABN6H835_9BACT|nr:LacI family transcriptional regulator [Haloferula helveola]
MGDVAREAGVSKNTVSLALRGSHRVAKETRERVEAVARDLGYQLNPTVAQLMSELRQNRTAGFQATLALVNANESRSAFADHPTVPIYVEGCRRRAERLGYALDEFWLHDPELSLARWQSIFRARNIRGALIVGMMSSNRLPVRLAPLWEEFPALVTGVRTRNPALSYACSDHHSLAILAFEKALELGYRRPAMVLDGVIDRLIEGRFTAGFLTAQSRVIPVSERTEPFFDVSGARIDLEVFRRWFEVNRPDVIFTLYHDVARWIEEIGLRCPEDVGLIQYEWREDHAAWAGMNQHNDQVGEAAVDMLVSLVQHHERGISKYPRATLIGSEWVDGVTVRPNPKH